VQPKGSQALQASTRLNRVESFGAGKSRRRRAQANLKTQSPSEDHQSFSQSSADVAHWTTARKRRLAGRITATRRLA
jgi:hypothetical protein